MDVGSLANHPMPPLISPGLQSFSTSEISQQEKAFKAKGCGNPSSKKRQFFLYPLAYKRHFKHPIDNQALIYPQTCSFLVSKWHPHMPNCSGPQILTPGGSPDSSLSLNAHIKSNNKFHFFCPLKRFIIKHFLSPHSQCLVLSFLTCHRSPVLWQ